MRKLFIILTFIILALSCKKQQNQQTISADTDSIISQIKLERIQKDTSFKNDDDSPIPDNDKPRFSGLCYFPIDLKYRFRLPLHQHKDGGIVKIITSRGRQRDAEKYGHFEFEMDAKNYRLQVYKMLDIQARHPGHLFVPFTDATSNIECYGGGRYLDLQENDSGYYVLDFNLAYNPLCAYGKESYNCPIPPAENRLDVAIRAGEKNYPLKSH